MMTCEKCGKALAPDDLCWIARDGTPYCDVCIDYKVAEELPTSKNMASPSRFATKFG